MVFPIAIATPDCRKTVTKKQSSFRIRQPCLSKQNLIKGLQVRAFKQCQKEMSTDRSGFGTNPDFDKVAGLTAILAKTLSNPHNLRDWILSKHPIKQRQKVLEEEHPLALPPELPYDELVGCYRCETSESVQTRYCRESITTTLYRHDVFLPTLPRIEHSQKGHGYQEKVA